MLDLPFNRIDTPLAASYTLFGKLPNRADFVRVNANHPAALEFDGLVQRVFERADVAVDSFEAAGRSHTVDFQYVSRDRRYVLVGVLIPSRDQAGRRYPLVAAAILPCEVVEAYLPVSPIVFEVFFDGLRDQVTNAVDNSVEALSCRQFLESSLRAYEAADDDLLLARNVVERFMAGQTVRRMADLLLNSSHPENFQQALLNIAFYQAYLRRFDNRATNQLVLLPLSGNKGEHALIASTWLSILSALWPVTEPGSAWRGSYLFVSRPGEDAQLVASVGCIPDSFSSVMLGGTIDRSMLLDLGVEHDAWKSHRMYAEASYALGRLLADPDFRLSKLLGFLENMSRQLEGSI